MYLIWLYVPIVFFQEPIKLFADHVLFLDHTVLWGLSHFKSVLESLQFTNSLIFLSLQKKEGEIALHLFWYSDQRRLCMNTTSGELVYKMDYRDSFSLVSESCSLLKGTWISFLQAFSYCFYVFVFASWGVCKQKGKKKRKQIHKINLHQVVLAPVSRRYATYIFLWLLIPKYPITALEILYICLKRKSIKIHKSLRD